MCKQEAPALDDAEGPAGSGHLPDRATQPAAASVGNAGTRFNEFQLEKWLEIPF